MATLTYSEGVSSESCVVSSVHTNFLFNLLLSLAPKHLLFVSYKSQKRAAKYSQFFTARKQPSVNFNLWHKLLCACALSPTCVKILFVRSALVCIDSGNRGKPQCLPRTCSTELFSLEYLMLALDHTEICLCLVIYIYPWH